MKTHNLAFIDLETTGLLLEWHEIIEIGCIVARQIPQDFGGARMEVIEEIEFKVRPDHIETADPKGLEINGYDPAAWANAISLKEALAALSEKTKGAIMVAHNGAFDRAFLEHGFEKTGVKDQMHYHQLDTIPIAFAKLYAIPSVQKFSLKELCAYYGIENKKAHTALSDARATYELYKKLMEI